MTNIITLVNQALVGKIIKIDCRQPRRILEVEWEYNLSGDVVFSLTLEGSNYRARIGLEMDFELSDD